MTYNDEQRRFGQASRLWDQIHPPGSPEWTAYLQEHLELGTVFDPTFTIKDGIIYDARQLLADVAEMVDAQRREGGRETTSSLQ